MHIITQSQSSPHFSPPCSSLLVKRIIPLIDFTYINDNIIKVVREKNELVNSGADTVFIDAYQQQIEDLKIEHERAVLFDT